MKKGHPPRTVLVVEDTRMTRRMMVGMLRELGFATTEAGDGKEGLRMLEEPRPVCVLVDWNMAELDGLGFVRAVRAQRAYDDVKLMMVTTEAEKMRVVEALGAGANEYLMKPFTREDLAQKLALLGIRGGGD